MEITLDSHIWLIAYINSDFMDRVEQDLRKYGDRYKGVVAYIPTVKILRKQFKGKNEFEDVPLLFNYGFFKIPRNKTNIEFINKMSADIPAIYAWVKDPMRLIGKKPAIRIMKDSGGNEVELKVPLPPGEELAVAMATEVEINLMVKTQSSLTIYSKEDIENLRKGDLVTLRGYPFDDMPAKIISINPSSQKMQVELLLEAISREVTVSFDNVFYTIYQGGFSENGFREKSLDDINAKGRHIVDKLYLNNQS